MLDVMHIVHTRAILMRPFISHFIFVDFNFTFITRFRLLKNKNNKLNDPRKKRRIEVKPQKNEQWRSLESQAKFFKNKLNETDEIVIKIHNVDEK